jgi:Rho termination factor, N-terminal domain
MSMMSQTKRHNQQGRHFKCFPSTMSSFVPLLNGLFESGMVIRSWELDKGVYYINLNSKQKCTIRKVSRLLNCRAELLSGEITHVDKRPRIEEKEEIKSTIDNNMKYPDHLKTMTKFELMELAKNHGIPNARLATKDELITRILKKTVDSKILEEALILTSTPAPALAPTPAPVPKPLPPMLSKEIELRQRMDKIMPGLIEELKEVDEML